MLFRPPLFWLSGLLWLVLSSLAGAAMLLTTTTGWSLPPGLRLVHVHAALVGGVAQIILGSMLTFISPLLLTGGSKSDSHGVLFAAHNAGTIGVVTGFALRDYTLVGIAGFIVLLVFLSTFTDLVKQ